jgi:hypothetical protein
MINMGIVERLKYRMSEKPNIVSEGSYVIIGSKNHGQQIPQEGIVEIIEALRDIIALKMEGREQDLSVFHPFSSEIIAKTAVGLIPVTFIPESGEEDLGAKLLNYGVPGELIEVSVPFIYLRITDWADDNIHDKLDMILRTYKNERYNFIDVNRAKDNFNKVLEYWQKEKLDVGYLDHFSLDFEKFTGDVREFEFWKPDLERFRSNYMDKGKIAVCCGFYHVPFVKTILDGLEPKKPDWENRDFAKSKISSTYQDPEKLREIYLHLNKALSL